MNNLGSGVLLPIFSIPSKYGIGSFGKDAYKFIDFLADCGVKYYQVLPLGEVTFGNSPYSSISNYAGGMLYIDLDELVKMNLLFTEEVNEQVHNTKKIDYEWLKINRPLILKKAYHRFEKSEMNEFILKNDWLTPYAIYMVLKDRFDGKEWTKWEKYKDYKAIDVSSFVKENEDEIYFYYFIQYIFFKQWNSLKKYANDKGIKIIGDVPIYSSFDSVDVWSNIGLYKINDDFVMDVVSGCPPDGFSKVGQVWNNPIYNYELMRKDGYSSLINKFRHVLKMFDMVRLDHFRGYEAYYEIPNGEVNGLNGEWKKGPDKELFDIMNKEFGKNCFIAEDLGFLTKEVEELLSFSNYPGMRVLEFGFDGNPNNKYLTKNYPLNSIAYSGTHDNAPLKSWLRDKITYSYVSKCYETENVDRIVDLMINDLMSSKSKIVIIQLQDYMHLGLSSRINTPGTIGKNWEYRLTESYDKKKLREYIYTKIKQSTRL